MTPRQKRLWMLVAVLAGISLAVGFGLKAFQSNMNLFFYPKDLVAGKVPPGRPIRIGGMVEKGSIVRVPGSLEVTFRITDYTQTVPVRYTGLLPDLFRDGQGTIAHGEWKDGAFIADEVLAKHDEKYMPPEVAKLVKERAAQGAPTETAQ